MSKKILIKRGTILEYIKGEDYFFYNNYCEKIYHKDTYIVNKIYKKDGQWRLELINLEVIDKEIKVFDAFVDHIGEKIVNNDIKLGKYNIEVKHYFGKLNNDYYNCLVIERNEILTSTFINNGISFFGEEDTLKNPVLKKFFENNVSAKYLKILDDYSNDGLNKTINIENRYIDQMTCKKLGKGVSINENNIDTIYYFVDYYPLKLCEKCHNPFFWKNYNLINDFINGYQDSEGNNPAGYYYACLKNNIKSITGQWIICSIPKKNDIDFMENNVNKMIIKYFNDKNITIAPDLLIRDNNDEYSLNKNYNLKDKNIIVLDDLLSSDKQFLRIKKCLLETGINKLLCFALGKHKNY